MFDYVSLAKLKPSRTESYALNLLIDRHKAYNFDTSQVMQKEPSDHRPYIFEK